VRLLPAFLTFLALTLSTTVRAADELETLFTRAATDPDAVVPLVLSGSRRIIGVDVAQGISLAQRLEPYCQRLFFSRERFAAMADAHVLLATRDGRSLWSLARRYHIGDQLVLRINPRDPAQYKVIDARSAPVTVVVALAHHCLLLWLGDTLLGIYPVASGAPGHQTPLGQTQIAVRVRDPEWRDPVTGTVYPPHAAGNFLGGYWLGFAATGARTFRGIGIHGWTAQEEGRWVGQDASHGCIRMRQADLPEVFDLALPGSRVSIRR